MGFIFEMLRFQAFFFYNLIITIFQDSMYKRGKILFQRWGKKHNTAFYSRLPKKGAILV